MTAKSGRNCSGDPAQGIEANYYVSVAVVHHNHHRAGSARATFRGLSEGND